MKIRSIKPEFWKSEKVARLPYAVRLFFIGLFNLADDHGRFRAHPRIVRGELFAYDDDADVAGWLTELQRAGLVALYEVDGTAYGWVRGFSEHQKIDRRADSRLPAPPVPAHIPAGSAESTAGSANKPADSANISAGSATKAAGSTQSTAGSAGFSVLDLDLEREMEVEREGEGSREGEPDLAPLARRPVSVGSASPEPEPEPEPEPRRIAERPPDVAPDLWRDFLSIRTAKRKPLTKRAWAAIANRIAASGVSVTQALTESVEHGWADWGPGWADAASRKLGAKPVEPPRNMGPSALAACVVHNPDDPGCACERCEIQRRRANGYGEQVPPARSIRA